MNHGIGKSTLILQICNNIKGEGTVLYVSGEESASQIKMRADRLNIKNEKISFLRRNKYRINRRNYNKRKANFYGN